MSSSRLPDPEMGNAPNPNMTESGGRSLFPVSEYFSRPQPAHPPPFDRSTKPSAGRQSANSPPRPTVIQGGPSENIPIRPMPPPIPPHVHGPSNTTDAQPRPQAQHEGRQNVESPSDTSLRPRITWPALSRRWTCRLDMTPKPRSRLLESLELVEKR